MTRASLRRRLGDAAVRITLVALAAAAAAAVLIAALWVAGPW